MAAVSKVILLPAPVQTKPAVERWGLYNLTINPFTKNANVTLVSVDAYGNQVANGDSLAFGVSGAQYDGLIGGLASSVMTAITAGLIAAGKVAPGTTLVDAAE